MHANQTMVRMAWIAGASVIMLVELLMLPTRSPEISNIGADHPRIPLPTATNSYSVDSQHRIEELTWTEGGGWVAEGYGSIRDEEIAIYLRNVVERCQTQKWTPEVRLRVPSDAAADHFMSMARSAEQAGISVLLIAVCRPDTHGRIAQQGVAPNRSLPLYQKSTSPVRGSED